MKGPGLTEVFVLMTLSVGKHKTVKSTYKQTTYMPEPVSLSKLAGAWSESRSVSRPHAGVNGWSCPSFCLRFPQLM